jgi:hypothetical protein
MEGKIGVPLALLSTLQIHSLRSNWERLERSSTECIPTFGPSPENKSQRQVLGLPSRVVVGRVQVLVLYNTIFGKLRQGVRKMSSHGR